MPNHAFGEGIFPNIQPEPPLAQCEAVASHPVKEFISMASEDLEGKKSNDQIFRVAQLTQTGQHAFCALEGLFGLAVVWSCGLLVYGEHQVTNWELDTNFSNVVN